ncbi:MAG: hypothetical protein KJP22_13130 [Acidimicrobiia bacterium]|nr:hypothetical protein [Acidimicrobiia bacterium]MBT8194342.1 hypothetical protein [Acidimicrobiia bacterium]NNL12438.1 hypothetical protein [Acidimicrobiia bacterium]RZV46766.1 MAG: hypothetical protein EX267_02710 [Acidimicrobiia bacterium]
MTPERHAELVEWLSSTDNPPVRYLTARDLVDPAPSHEVLRTLRADILDWEPLRSVLNPQKEDGSFPFSQKTPTAQPTFTALGLMYRCGLVVTDEPVARAVTLLSEHHLGKGALSYTTGGSGILPCYIGVVVTALIGLGAFETDVVQSSIQWLIDHQRFDHKDTRAGGPEPWPYKAPFNYGCWESVSCYHGVAGAFRAFAAIPPQHRTPAVTERLEQALDYLRIHRLYKRSALDRPLFRHMTRFFLVGDYRSDLLDMLQGIADADPALINEDWVRDAFDDMSGLTDDGAVTLVKNYGRRLIDPIPFEPIGAPSRFLTYQWLAIGRTLTAIPATI